MTAFVCNTRNNPISTIKENVSSDANFKTSESPVISETANLILIFKINYSQDSMVKNQ